MVICAIPLLAHLLVAFKGVTAAETGWKDVIKGELIEADLDDVAIQIKTISDEDGEVEIQFPDGNLYLFWSTKPSAPFVIGGTCNPNKNNDISDNQVNFHNMNIIKSIKLRVNYICKGTYTVSCLLLFQVLGGCLIK